MTTLKWGILSTGRIAKIFSRQLAQSKTGILHAVASRDKEAARNFAKQFLVPRWYGNYQDLIDDPEVDIVYVATPHPMHAEWVIKATEAQKHILCEKPIGLNADEAKKMIDAARENRVFLMEAFAYRCHPQTAKLIELIKDGAAIGEVRVIQATFSFITDYDLQNRALNHSLGGGGILDVGCYCVSMARLIAGIALGENFAEPVEVKGCGHIGEESRVDEWAIASLKFPKGIVAQLSTGVQVNQENVVRIFGSKGHIILPTPWIVSIDGGTSRILVFRDKNTIPEEIKITTEQGLFAIEADTAARFAREGQAAPPAMSWNDSIGNMITLDRWRESIGLRYDMET